MGGTRRLCLLSNSSHPKVDSKDENVCLSNDCSSPRVARDDLDLGPNRSFHKTSTTTSTLGNSSQISQPSCLAPGLETKISQKFSESVAERFEAPQRFLSRRVYESRWSLFESWCNENQVDFYQPSLSSIADFLAYLLLTKSLNLLPLLAIAGHLGSDFDISKIWS